MMDKVKSYLTKTINQILHIGSADVIYVSHPDVLIGLFLSLEGNAMLFLDVHSGFEGM